MLRQKETFNIYSLRKTKVTDLTNKYCHAEITEFDTTAFFVLKGITANYIKRIRIVDKTGSTKSIICMSLSP